MLITATSLISAADHNQIYEQLNQALPTETH